MGALASGAEAVLLFSATVDSAQEGVEIEIGAQITGTDQLDDVPANYNDVVTLTVETEAECEITIVVDDATPAVGADVVYTITVTNNGPAAAAGLVAHFHVIDGLTWKSDVHEGTAYDAVTGVWTIGTLAAEASVVLAITETVALGQEGLTKVATATIVEATRPDENATNDEDTVEITVES